LGLLISSDTVLIGHSLENDLIALRIVHTKCMDTAHLYEHPRGFPYRMKLKVLAETHLNWSIQQSQLRTLKSQANKAITSTVTTTTGDATATVTSAGATKTTSTASVTYVSAAVIGHDSIDDARAALELVRLKLLHGPLFGSGGARGRNSAHSRTSLLVEVANRRKLTAVSNPSDGKSGSCGGSDTGSHIVNSKYYASTPPDVKATYFWPVRPAVQLNSSRLLHSSSSSSSFSSVTSAAWTSIGESVLGPLASQSAVDTVTCRPTDAGGAGDVLRRLRESVHKALVPPVARSVSAKQGGQHGRGTAILPPPQRLWVADIPMDLEALPLSPPPTPQGGTDGSTAIDSKGASLEATILAVCAAVDSMAASAASTRSKVESIASPNSCSTTRSSDVSSETPDTSSADGMTKLRSDITARGLWASCTANAATVTSETADTSHTLVLLCLQRRSDDLASLLRLRRVSRSPRASLPWSMAQEAGMQSLAAATNSATVFLKII
jgi:hypothetical protein